MVVLFWCCGTGMAIFPVVVSCGAKQKRNAMFATPKHGLVHVHPLALAIPVANLIPFIWWQDKQGTSGHDRSTLPFLDNNKLAKK